MRPLGKRSRCLRTAGFLALTTALAFVCELCGVGKESVVMLYLLCVWFTAIFTRSALWGGVSAIAGLFLLNFFFSEPRYTLIIHNYQEAILLVFFLISAVVAGILGSHVQQLRQKAEAGEQAARELLETRARQEEIRLAMDREKLRADLLRSVTHDLRSPLTALAGEVSLLEDDYEKMTDAERKKFIRDMNEEIFWLTDLVENVLNMTRISENHMILNKEEEVVDDVVSEAVARMERQMRGRRFTVELPETVILAPMDGRLIVRVLDNLLNNAVRHTPPDSEISLSVRQEGDHLLFAVADTGCGVDPALREKIFQRYFHSETGVADGFQGMGMGLALCRTFVEAHGGRLWLEENRPQGSRFLFTLPLTAEKEDP